MRPGLILALLLACNEPASTDVEPVPTPACPTFGTPVTTGQMSSPPASEISGLAVGDGVIWVHNDSGPAVVHAIDPDGTLLATVELDGVQLRDFEDMARAPGPDGRPWLYVGDIGDNSRVRDFVQVYRFPEPAVADAVVTVERLDLRYPDGPRDAETLMVDPVDGTLWIVSKEPEGNSGFYRLLRPMPGPSVLERALTKTFGEPPLGQTTLVTGGDLEARGLVLRTYLQDAYLWARADGESVIEALQRDPCPVRLAGEAQPEAIGWAPDGLYTISEGSEPPVHFHPLED